MSTDQLTPAITLPSTQATHVVGETSMPLAEGDLCLYITPPAKDVNPSHEGLVEEEESTVDHFGGGVGNEQADEQILTLTVGKAAFPLFRSTMFGTMDGDERVYLFQPKLGEVGG